LAFKKGKKDRRGCNNISLLKFTAAVFRGYNKFKCFFFSRRMTYARTPEEATNVLPLIAHTDTQLTQTKKSKCKSTHFKHLQCLYPRRGYNDFSQKFPTQWRRCFRPHKVYIFFINISWRVDHVRLFVSLSLSFKTIGIKVSQKSCFYCR